MSTGWYACWSNAAISTPWDTLPGPDSRSCMAPRPPSWRGSGSSAPTSCPPGGGSCRAPRSSSNSRSACDPAPMPEGRPGRPRHDREDADPPSSGERLQKVLARVGLGSRRACEELIADGRVTVNGEPATLGRRVDVGHDVVALDGLALPVLPGLVHYLL